MTTNWTKYLNILPRKIYKWLISIWKMFKSLIIKKMQIKTSRYFIPIRIIIIKRRQSQVLLAHACNPSCLGGWNQEDCGLRLAWPNSSQNPSPKIYWRCGTSSRGPDLQVWSPEFKPQSHQKKKKDNNVLGGCGTDGNISGRKKGHSTKKQWTKEYNINFLKKEKVNCE
jgi:hypothetical protein